MQVASLFLLLVCAFTAATSAEEFKTTIALTNAIEHTSLVRYVRDGKARGARLVVRGCDLGDAPFKTNYFRLASDAQRAQKRRVLECLKHLGELSQTTGATIEIAPDVFRTYRITSGPVFIFENVDGLGNDAILRGLVSTDWAYDYVKNRLAQIRSKEPRP